MRVLRESPRHFEQMHLLLLPSQELGEIIRYETHLEDQVERKLRQFYARRREPVLVPADSLPDIPAEAIELACPQGIA